MIMTVSEKQRQENPFNTVYGSYTLPLAIVIKWNIVRSSEMQLKEYA